MPHTIDNKQASDWMRQPSRRQEWIIDFRSITRPMTDDEWREWQRSTAGEPIVMDWGSA